MEADLIDVGFVDDSKKGGRGGGGGGGGGGGFMAPLAGPDGVMPMPMPMPSPAPPFSYPPPGPVSGCELLGIGPGASRSCVARAAKEHRFSEIFFLVIAVRPILS